MNKAKAKRLTFDDLDAFIKTLAAAEPIVARKGQPFFGVDAW